MARLVSKVEVTRRSRGSGSRAEPDLPLVSLSHQNKAGTMSTMSSTSPNEEQRKPYRRSWRSRVGKLRPPLRWEPKLNAGGVAGARLATAWPAERIGVLKQPRAEMASTVASARFNWIPHRIRSKHRWGARPGDGPVGRSARWDWSRPVQIFAFSNSVSSIPFPLWSAWALAGTARKRESARHKTGPDAHLSDRHSHTGARMMTAPCRQCRPPLPTFSE
jgi:hypothetical protein